MRRPLPPELIVLGDQLEAAATTAIARRRARRQLVLNAAASLIVAVPLGMSVASRPAALPTVPAVPDVRTAPATHVPADFIPRDLRRRRGAPHAELVPLPTNLRRALR